MGNEYFYSGDSIGIIGGAEAGTVGVMGAFFLIYGMIMLFTLAYSITTYVLYSLGLYTVAQRRRISKPWLAWIPVGNLWLLGSISDQYQHLAKGKITGRRKILLGLCIASVVMYFVWLFSMVLGLVLAEASGMAAGSVLIMLLDLLVFFAIVITLAVFEYMCYYDLYCSCDPNNGALFLVLSIIFSGIMPFFVFACRKKDKGMPRPQQPAPVAEMPVKTVEPEEVIIETEGESENEQEEPVADA